MRTNAQKEKAPELLHCKRFTSQLSGYRKLVWINP